MSSAANGHKEARARAPRLPGSKAALIAKSTPVASQMPAERRHRAMPGPPAAAMARRAAPGLVVSVIARSAGRYFGGERGASPACPPAGGPAPAPALSPPSLAAG